MMSIYQEQHKRVKRFYDKIQEQDRDQTEYEDDLWAFSQNCWHLKDWIKNDQTLSAQNRNQVETEVHKYDSLKRIADLTNRSKHLKLDNKRLDADITKKAVTVTVSTGKQTKRKYNYTVEDKNGTEIDALDLAQQALNDWDEVLKKLGI